MKLTVVELKSRYDSYNALYFDGELPTKCRFYLIKDAMRVGNATANPNRRCSPKIGISDRILWTDGQLRDAIVHEMIHLWEWENFGKMTHGKIFKAKMKELNDRYGMNIRVKGGKFTYKGAKKKKMPLWEHLLRLFSSRSYDTHR